MSGVSVGLGRVLVNMSIDGLTAAEWAMVSQVVMRVKSPQGQIVDTPAVIAPQNKIEATVLFDQADSTLKCNFYKRI